MKLSELFETASTGMTSVASIGKVEYAAFPDRIKLFKRDQNNCPMCVAMIKRKKKDGWRMIPTENWKKMKLPHIGYLYNLKAPKNGKVTLSKELPEMMKRWGVKYDELMPMMK